MLIRFSFLFILSSTKYFFFDVVDAQSSVFVCDDDFDCQPNGFCANDQRCSCNSNEFVGDQCQYKCPLNCQNGATCQVLQDDHGGIEVDFYCQCREGFSGGLCQDSNSGEAEVEDDEDCPLDCSIGGTCMRKEDEHGGIELEYYCECIPGYTGGLCQNVVTSSGGSSNNSGGGGNNNNDGQKMTVGAVVGITIGVLLLVIGLVTLVVRRIRRSTGRQQEGKDEKESEKEKGTDSVEVSGLEDDDDVMNGGDDDTKSLPSVA